MGGANGVIIIFVFSILMVLYLVSRKLPLSEDYGNVGFRTPFFRMAIWSYRKWNADSRFSPVNSRALRDLYKLHPNMEEEQLKEVYFVQKWSLTLIIILIGTGLAGVILLQTNQNLQLQDGNLIYRGDFSKKEKEIDLTAFIDGHKKTEVKLTVHGRIPEKTDADKLEKEFWEEMCKVVLGDNLSFQQISQDLCLETSLSDFPFEVEWSFDQPYLISDTGIVTLPEEGESKTAVLTATVKYHKWEWSHDLKIRVVGKQLSEQDILNRELSSLLMKLELNGRNEEILSLPDEWQGETLEWTQQTPHHEYFVWILSFVAAISTFVLKDKDLHDDVLKREKLLRKEYPFIVNKLLLYMGAGLTARGAFFKIAEDYSHINRGNAGLPAYEEVLHMCRELQTGSCEADAYENLGKRCGLQEYVRLTALLTQNLKKGNSTLLRQLREEMDTALREQMNRCRRVGEEASTRLLVPTIMILAMVMALIMIPAFNNF